MECWIYKFHGHTAQYTVIPCYRKTADAGSKEVKKNHNHMMISENASYAVPQISKLVNNNRH
jgi:predicted P-loop ATPase/GTPase